MAEIKQGLNYEITADDKASAVADKASKNVQKSSKEAGEETKKAGIAGADGFNALSLVTNALSGNFAACGQELAKLLPRFKNTGAAGTIAFAAIGAAVLGITKALGAVKDLIQTAFNTGTAPKELQSASAALADVKANADAFAEAMAKSRAEAERQNKIFEDEVSAIKRLTNAQNEFNRAIELANATSEKQRLEINQRYDAGADLLEANAAAQLRENKRKSIKDEESRLMEELAAAEKRRDLLLDTSSKMTKVANESRTGIWESIWGDIKSFFTGKKYGNDKALAALNAGTQASNDYFTELEKIEELEKKIEENRHAQKMANLEEEAATEEFYADQQKKVNDEWKALDDVIKKEAEEEKKAVEEVKAAKLKAHREVMTERRKDLAALTDQESHAAARLAAAQSKVAEAWGWYRDKDKMAAQLKEEKAEAEAQKQFEKDFEDLKWRRDWRTAKDLSVDQEAVRRVALAKEEETAAQKALAETAKSTAQAAASLAEIEKVITQEG